MAESSVKALIVRLLLRTGEGKLKWEETPTEGVFQTAFPEYVVRIMERSNDYVIRVLDSNGSVVEEETDSDLRGDWPQAYGVMRELYIEARRSAKGVDKAIRDILSALEEEDDDIPF